MRFRFSMILFGLAVGLLTSCSSSEIERDIQLEKAVETMLEALRARDDGAILALAANPQDFGENGRLQEDVAGFLYDGDYIRGYGPDARSVERSWRLVRCGFISCANWVAGPRSSSYRSGSRRKRKSFPSTPSVGCAIISPASSIWPMAAGCCCTTSALPSPMGLIRILTECDRRPGSRST